MLNFCGEGRKTEASPAWEVPPRRDKILPLLSVRGPRGVILGLRRRFSNIENRPGRIDGARHKWFRVVSGPVAEASRPQPPSPAENWRDRPRLTGLPPFDEAAQR